MRRLGLHRRRPAVRSPPAALPARQDVERLHVRPRLLALRPRTLFFCGLTRCRCRSQLPLGRHGAPHHRLHVVRGPGRAARLSRRARIVNFAWFRPHHEPVVQEVRAGGAPRRLVQRDGHLLGVQRHRQLRPRERRRVVRAVEAHVLCARLLSLSLTPSCNSTTCFEEPRADDAARSPSQVSPAASPSSLRSSSSSSCPTRLAPRSVGSTTTSGRS